MPNRLAGQTSPYLLQHAGNPVNWQPWDEEALAVARAQDRPILLSIGYAACHWCHVMAHESFEDPETAALMNDKFVCIKVDREERPDLDAVYMQAVQAMTGRGGWPMTVFLTPDGEPFYGGTYFPLKDGHGLPSFKRVLTAIADTYENRRESVDGSVASIRGIYDATLPRGDNETISDEFLDNASRAIIAGYDKQYGGFGGAPKFPPTMILDFLLRHWARTGDRASLDVATWTFTQMAHGGIYDQIGGGFARYSVDAYWLVPHFEKMLYDNALVIRFGAHLFEATKSAEVRRVTEETVEWLTREMTSPEGGFYSSLDADSDGEEGRFYVWTPDEIDASLGADAATVRAYFGVTTSGNFEGRNILHVPVDPGTFAERVGTTAEDLQAKITSARDVLYQQRATRVWPARDDKTLAAWNGLALRGLVEAARAFDRDDFRAIAARNAEFLLAHMVIDGRVMRSYKNGVAHIRGFLDDQAAVALGFLAMFEQSLDIRWLSAARQLALVMQEEFWDEQSQTFYDTSRDAERLVTRPHDPTDNATPSGTSLAVDLMLRLANYDGDAKLSAHATRVIASLASAIARYPSGFGHLLGDAEYAATFACSGDYCDMPSPAALDIARGDPTSD
ncbi:MAG: thioredoxin domain-containing protein [Gemmatimonadaceae bacterium]